MEMSVGNTLVQLSTLIVMLLNLRHHSAMLSDQRMTTTGAG